MLNGPGEFNSNDHTGTLKRTNISHRKGNGKSSTQKCHFWGDMLVPWRKKRLINQPKPLSKCHCHSVGENLSCNGPQSWLVNLSNPVKKRPGFNGFKGLLSAGFPTIIQMKMLYYPIEKKLFYLSMHRFSCAC